MIIGVIADTHIPTRAKELPGKLIEHLKKVDLIMHAGDFVHLEVLEMLEKMKRVEAVSGNMDEEILKTKLPPRKIVKVGSIKIGLVHGFDIPWDLKYRVPANFKKNDVQCVVYGHTHIPRNEKIGGRLYFNPGSPTDTIFAAYSTYGILRIEGNKIQGEIVKI